MYIALVAFLVLLLIFSAVFTVNYNPSLGTYLVTLFQVLTVAVVIIAVICLADHFIIGSPWRASLTHGLTIIDVIVSAGTIYLLTQRGGHEKK